MKYVKLVNEKEASFTRIRRRINIGDNFQSFSVDRLFLEANISDDSIINVSYLNEKPLSEPCKVVMQGHFGRNINMSFIHDKNIEPVFIGFGLMDSFLTDEEVEYYKRHQPILCRDEFTKKTLVNYGIDAYLFGCMSLVIDRKASYNSINGKYYFVDVQKEVIDNLPEKVKRNAVFLSQNIPEDEYELFADNGDTYARLRLIEYCENAKAVFTRKLHCMCPTVGMGIPTFAVGDNFSYRFGFVDALIPCFNAKTINAFDWDGIPEVEDTVELKSMLLRAGVSMIKGTPDIGTIKWIDHFFCARKRWDYCLAMKMRIKDFFGTEITPCFIIWGASAGGYTVYHCMKELFPNCQLEYIVDSYNEGIWEGKLITRPEIIKYVSTKVKIIIATLSGKDEAEKLLVKYGRVKNKDYCFIHESA